MKRYADIGKNLKIDVARLIDTRMLIQANSGGGKSWAIRRFAEQTNGMVQHIILDSEGEFASLRKKFDYVLAGPDGDIKVEPRHAQMLAKRVMELGFSLIVDLSELDLYHKQEFVKNFLTAMVDLPKNLWKAVVVILDEAHLFAPESGKGKTDSLAAVVGMASKGRKRGMCLVLATQRMAKLSKDAAAECRNKLVGLANLPEDRNRAASDLGLTDKKDIEGLARLDDGVFYAIGPAISRELVKGRVGPIQTPETKYGKNLGKRQIAPTAKVRAVLGKLKDLPKKAEAEIRNLEQAKAEIRKLRGELTRVQKVQGPNPADLKAAERRGYLAASSKLQKATVRYVTSMEGLHRENLKILANLKLHAKDKEPVEIAAEVTVLPAKVILKPKPGAVSNVSEPEGLGKCDQAILGFLISYPGRYFGKVQVAVMSGYSQHSSSFSHALGKLSRLNLISRNGTDLSITAAGQESGIEPKSQGVESWVNRLGKCERAIFRCLKEAEREMAKQDVAMATGYSTTSSSFSHALGRLNSLGLIRRTGNGALSMNPEISEL